MKIVNLVKPADMGNLIAKKLAEMHDDKVNSVCKLLGLDAEYDRDDRCFFLVTEA